MAAKIVGNLDISSLVILTLVQFYQLKSASSFAFRFFFFLMLDSAARQSTFLSEFSAAERSAPDRCSSHGIVSFAFPCKLVLQGWGGWRKLGKYH